MNKDNISNQEKNSVLTPEAIQEALCSLPFNYALQAFDKLNRWKEEGKIKKSFSKRYIIKVQKQEQGAFNEHILKALVEVGIENMNLRNRYGRITKKASPSN